MNRRSRFKYPILQMILIFTMALGAAAFAVEESKMTGSLGSRAAPSQIQPVDIAGVRYSNRPEEMDFVIATELQGGKPGKQLWKQRVLHYWIDPKAPRESAIYFRSMVRAEGDSKLLIKDESGTSYLLDLKTREVSILNWPLQVTAVGWAPKGDGWSYRVKITMQNTLTRILKFDEPSIAFQRDGIVKELQNDLFQVTSDGKPVRYRGMMKKRAPPDHFLELKPGEIYESVVDLGENYPIPAGAHDVTVAFEHRNHFSPDPFVMTSAPAKFRLDGILETSTKPKPKAP